MQEKKPFLNTAMGSWLKIFLAAALTQYLIIIGDPDQVLLSFESLKSLGIAGSVAAVPVIINWLNPNYPLYGKYKEQQP